STLLGMKNGPKLPERLSKILAPTLLIWGDSDNMIPLQYSAEYEKILGSKLVIIKDCGHTPYVEQPAVFNQIVLKFLL
ncbi:MAG TPA: alpha/beta hydrolase, partial [Nitrososphaeraceae archaeon]